MSWQTIPEDLKNEITSLLGVTHLCQLSACSATERKFCQQEMGHRVRVALAKFDIDPLSFLAALKEWNGVVGGAVPLCILVASQRMVRDLSVYVPRGALDAFTAYMMDQNTFTILFTRDHAYKGSAMDNIPGVHRVRYMVQRKLGFILSIAESQSTSSIVPIVLSQSTAAMNYFTSDTFTSVYPLITYRRIAIANVLDFKPGRALPPLLKAYADRGFSIVGSASDVDGPHRCMEHVHCNRNFRDIEDKGVLSMSFGEGPFDFADRITGVKWRLAINRPCTLRAADGQGVRWSILQSMSFTLKPFT
ncbi:hypothetical protein BKA70DRAFT_1450899 [Coprinopsis sp. MPI-PUGE-AT-0042]|nr:hypothetical protein BKA70DRAFT_1450899 [Coprinopsis sp. MPI-PUGE-AT-0042]